MTAFVWAAEMREVNRRVAHHDATLHMPHRQVQLSGRVPVAGLRLCGGELLFQAAQFGQFGREVRGLAVEIEGALGNRLPIPEVAAGREPSGCSASDGSRRSAKSTGLSTPAAATCWINTCRYKVVYCPFGNPVASPGAGPIATPTAGR